MNSNEIVNFIKNDIVKWPYIFISGNPISSDLACEIIRRTDNFFNGANGNNLDYVEKWRNKFLMWEKFDPSKSKFEDYYQSKISWQKKWHFVGLNYLYNDWISSYRISGASGWVDIYGNIFYMSAIGKWPSIEEIDEDFKQIAKNFPFLNLAVTLFHENFFSNTFIKKEPIVSLKVEYGKLNWIKPNLLIHNEKALFKLDNLIKQKKQEQFLHRKENGIHDDLMLLWAKHAEKLF